MHASISKWGNSLAIRLPRTVATELKVDEGSKVELRVEGGTLVVTPARPRYTLKQLLAAMPRAVKGAEQELDWGAPTGKEIW